MPSLVEYLGNFVCKIIDPLQFKFEIFYFHLVITMGSRAIFGQVGFFLRDIPYTFNYMEPLINSLQKCK